MLVVNNFNDRTVGLQLTLVAEIWKTN